MTKKANLIGQVFGRLTVTAEAEPLKDGKSRWACSCSCGGSTVTSVTKLRSGHTSSCGCYRDERMRAPRDDEQMSGLRFGRLFVVGRSEKSFGTYGYMWRCKCDCGAEVIVSKHRLKCGDTKSCGCLQREMIIVRNTKHGLSKTREYMRAKDAKRRKWARESLKHFSAKDVQRVRALQKDRCPICRKHLGRLIDVDHIKPLSRGGDNGPDNIQILHRSCNRRKGAKDPLTFMQQNGYLL